MGGSGIPARIAPSEAEAQRGTGFASFPYSEALAYAGESLRPDPPEHFQRKECEQQRRPVDCRPARSTPPAYAGGSLNQIGGLHYPPNRNLRLPPHAP